MDPLWMAVLGCSCPSYCGVRCNGTNSFRCYSTRFLTSTLFLFLFILFFTFFTISWQLKMELCVWTLGSFLLNGPAQLQGNHWDWSYNLTKFAKKWLYERGDCKKVSIHYCWTTWNDDNCLSLFTGFRMCSLAVMQRSGNSIEVGWGLA